MENATEKFEYEKKHDGFYLLVLMLKYKVFMIVSIVIAIGASVGISLQMDNWYTSTVNAVPPKQSGDLLKSALGSMSSALKQFGMTKLGGSGEGYEFTVLLFSRSVKDSMIKKYDLATDYDIPDTAMTLLREEFGSNLDVTYEKDGNYTISIMSKDREKAAVMANDYIEITNGLAVDVFKSEAVFNRKYLERRIGVLDANITVTGDSLQKYSSKYMLFSPEDQAKAVSMAYSEMKAELLKQEMLYEMLVNKLGEKDYLAKSQLKLIAKLKAKIFESETTPGFAGNFTMKNATKISIEYMRLYAELETFTKVKDFLLPMLEDARLDENRNLQSLVVVDPAIPADKKTSPKRSLIVIGSVFGTFVLSVLFILLLQAYKDFKKKYALVKNSI
ncbi:MAG: hypothetical protein PF588_03395 [Candidatus Kapabacteria bacterium]|jgi:tyrosine-protein kinase Etk/Wzc|nr:hypothetical protein [Candidatus Kapabacteria bacterium]